MLLMLLFVLAASPSADAAVKAYRAMTPAQVEARLTETPPSGDGWEKIDVSEKIRSASFGHSTTLWVKGATFFVEYGRSTNKSGRTMGPFSSGDAPSDAGTRVTCGSATCAQGQVCCNASCGTCTPPGAMCTQQVCP